jgi:hypothetical protein
LEEFVRKCEHKTTLTKTGDFRTCWAPDKKAVYELLKGKRSISSFSMCYNQVYIPSGTSTFLILSGKVNIGTAEKIYQQCPAGLKLDLTRQFHNNSIRISNPFYRSQSVIIELSDKVENPQKVDYKKKRFPDYCEWAQNEKEIAELAFSTAQISSRILFPGYIETSHYHPNRKETIWIVNGKLNLIENHELYGLRDEDINRGVKQEINPNDHHSIKALENTILIELNDLPHDSQKEDKEICYIPIRKNKL